MADRLLKSKSNAELVEPIQKRIDAVETFLRHHGGQDLALPLEKCGRVSMDVVEIQDAFGPTAWDREIDTLVVSRETLSGGEAVNSLRKEKGLPELKLYIIEVIASALAHTHVMADIEMESATADSIPSSSLESTEERTAKLPIGVNDHHHVRTLDLSQETDEKRLKELKMGSTAIRKWIAEHDAQNS